MAGTGRTRSARLSVDEASLVLAVLHHAEEVLDDELAAVARQCADLVVSRIDSGGPDEPRSEASHLAHRYEDLRARFVSLQRDASDARQTSERLAREAQELKVAGRRLRGVIAQVVSLLGDDGGVVLDAADVELARLREELRAAAA